MTEKRPQISAVCGCYVIATHPPTHQGLPRLLLQFESSRYVAFKSFQPGVVLWWLVDLIPRTPLRALARICHNSLSIQHLPDHKIFLDNPSHPPKAMKDCKHPCQVSEELIFLLPGRLSLKWDSCPGMVTFGHSSTVMVSSELVGLPSSVQEVHL